MSEEEATGEAKVTSTGAGPENAFMLNNGESINSLEELYQKFQKMEPEVFYHHANDERNDFGNWVKDVHKDYQLANSLFSSKTRDECAKAVGDRLYSIQRTAEKKRCNAKKVHQGETAAERLEKILCEAVKRKAKAKELKAKKEEVKALPAPEKKDEIAPTAQELIESADGTDKECQELIEFSETEGFHKQLKKEVGTIFSRGSLASFKGDMKKLFTIGDRSEEVPRSTMEPEAAAKVKALAKLPEKRDTDDRIIAHLKKVYG